MHINTGEKLRWYTAIRSAQAITRTALEAVRRSVTRGLRGEWWVLAEMVMTYPPEPLQVGLLWAKTVETGTGPGDFKRGLLQED